MYKYKGDDKRLEQAARLDIQRLESGKLVDLLRMNKKPMYHPAGYTPRLLVVV